MRSQRDLVLSICFNKGGRKSVLLAAIAGLVSPIAAHAATFNWTGGDPYGYWFQGDNWDTNTVPANDGSADLHFGSTNISKSSPTNGFPGSSANITNVHSITFDAGAAPYTLNGVPFSVQSTLTDNAAGVQTINNVVSGIRSVSFGANAGTLKIPNGTGSGLNITAAANSNATLQVSNISGTSLLSRYRDR